LQVSRADRCACDAGDAGDAENVASVWLWAPLGDLVQVFVALRWMVEVQNVEQQNVKMSLLTLFDPILTAPRRG
jgi:hypothetical protein